MTDLSSFTRCALAVLLTVVVATGLTACDLFGGDDTFGGEVQVLLTDAPFPTDRVQEVRVSIDGADLIDGNRDAFALYRDSDKSFDLMELRGGTTAELVSADVPPGEFALLRLHLQRSATLVDQSGTEHEVTMAAEADSAVVVSLGRMTIESGATGRVTVDFTLDGSFTLPEGADPESVDLSEFRYEPTIQLQNLEEGINVPDGAPIPGGS